MVKILERAETMGDVLPRRTAVRKRYGKRYASNVGPCNVVLLPSRNALPWIVRSARNMIGFKQIEFLDHTSGQSGPLTILKPDQRCNSQGVVRRRQTRSAGALTIVGGQV